MDFQDLLRKIRTFLRHTKLVHFLFVTPRNIFRPVRARFFNKPWWPMKLFYHHEKCKVDFSRREHPRNTNRSSFPFLPFFFPSFFLFLFSFFFFIFVLFFLFIRFSRVVSIVEEDARASDARVPPPQIACKNAEWRREFFQIEPSIPRSRQKRERSKIRESR